MLQLVSACAMIVPLRSACLQRGLPEVLVWGDFQWWVLANTILQGIWICVVAYKELVVGSLNLSLRETLKGTVRRG